MNPATGRRSWLKTLAAALVAPLAWPGRAAAAWRTRRKHRWGMVIDLDRCTGCQGCVEACRIENNVPLAGSAPLENDRGIFWMDLITQEEGEYPDLRTQFLPVPCMHCDNAPCTKVCPVGATYVGAEGIVDQVWDRCIGCRYCMAACPYGRRHFNWKKPEWPEPTSAALNPDVATRPKGVVEKCTLCSHKLRPLQERAEREGRDVTDAEVRRLPACARSCPAEAITFGDLDDPGSEAHALSKSPRAFRLLEELGTRPKVIYLRESKWKE